MIDSIITLTDRQWSKHQWQDLTPRWRLLAAKVRGTSPRRMKMLSKQKMIADGVFISEHWTKLQPHKFWSSQYMNLSLFNASVQRGRFSCKPGHLLKLQTWTHANHCSGVRGIGGSLHGQGWDLQGLDLMIATVGLIVPEFNGSVRPYMPGLQNFNL